MQTTAPMSPACAIAVPDIDSDEPVAVIPIASVAPLDGPPDGERINTFTVAPKKNDAAPKDSGGDALGEMRASVRRKPLTYVAAAFSLGFLVGRVLR